MDKMLGQKYCMGHGKGGVVMETASALKLAHRFEDGNSASRCSVVSVTTAVQVNNMMDNCKLQVFCCCCNLRTGSLVIGTLGWLMTLIQLFYLTSPLKTEKRKYEDSEEDIAVEIGYSFVTLLVCVALIWGVYRNNRRFILPWLVLKCIECVIWTIITLIIFIMFFFMEGKLLMIFQFFVIFFVTTLCWYFWLCVWSLYNEMTEDFGTEIPMSQTVPMKEPMSQKDKEQYAIESV